MPYELENGSLESRLDAVSTNPHTAFSMGPVTDGDVDQGVFNRAWRCRHDPVTNSVYLQRANDSNNAWEAEALLFQYSGVSGTEIGFAFEQLGRPVVAVQRPTGVANAMQVWIRYYDPVSEAYTFTAFGDGRNPRLILDVPEVSASSDVMVVYCNDFEGRIVYRLQKDRYQVLYITNYDVVSNTYLQQMVRTTDNRLAAIVTVRNQATGKWSISRMESALLPYEAIDNVEVTAEILSGLVQHLGIPQDDLDLLMATIQNGALDDLVLDYTAYDLDGLNWQAASITTGELRSMVLFYTAYDVDGMDTSNASIQSGELKTVVLFYTAYDLDSMDTSNASITTGYLGV